MSLGPADEYDWADRWNQLFEVLSAEPRREILISLADAPRERRLPLPEAAKSPNQSMDSETLATRLRHHHLPKLADAGYVRWEADPFCVQRGPDFEEPQFILENVLESPDEVPHSLVNNCKILQKMTSDD